MELQTGEAPVEISVDDLRLRLWEKNIFVDSIKGVYFHVFVFNSDIDALNLRIRKGFAIRAYHIYPPRGTAKLLR